MRALEWTIERVGHLVVRLSRSASRPRRMVGAALAAATFCGLLPLVVLFVVVSSITRSLQRD